MIWVDYAILAIIVLSAVISVVRGFIREALSLAGWIVAIWVALGFSDELAPYFTEYISVPSVRLVAAFAILFIATLILAALVNYLAGQLVDKTGLSGTDRMLGVVFGVARGVAIVAILVLLAGTTNVPRDPWWSQSMFMHHFQDLAIWIRDLLPPDFASHISY